MQKVLVYQKVALEQKGFTIAEEQGRYETYLDAATEHYVRGLRELGQRCETKDENAGETFNDLVMLNHAMLQVCAQFEEAVADKDRIKAARVRFYARTNPILSKSYCINRVRTWPLGHQGDYLTLEGAYRNTPLSKGIGYYLDKYFLSTALAVGARERIENLAGLLKKELVTRKSPRVLDIACGSCREVIEIAPEIKQSGARLECMDLDSDALNFALNRISYTGLSSEQILFHQYNALRLFDYETAAAEFGTYDLIYSVGYFDYLPDDFLVKLLRSMYLILNPGGKLIMAFKDSDRYQSQVYHWIADWDGFYQRKMDDFARLLKEASIPEHALTLTRSKSGAIVFYTAAR